jgi:hypothetical protein
MLDRKAIWRVVEWDSVDHALYGVDGGSSILFRYDPQDGANGKVTELSRLCAERFYTSNRKDIPYSTLAFTIGKDRRIYYAPAGIDFDYEARLEGVHLSQAQGGLKITPYSELVVYDLKSRERTNLGMLKTKDGRNVYGCGGAAAGRDGTIYLCCATEVKDPQEAAGKVAGERDEPCYLFSFDPKGGGFHDLGVIAVDRSPYYSWRGYQFDSMATGADGTIYLGESERRSHLFIYSPE